MQYKELLKHPYWQIKRLSILQRDNFKCVKCTDELTNLQIHHLYYKIDNLPWEYPDDAFETLCELCHEKAEFVKWLFKHGPTFLQNQSFAPGDVKSIIDLVNRRLINNHHKESARRYMESIKILIYGQEVY